MRDSVKLLGPESIAAEHRTTLPTVAYSGRAGLTSLDLPKDTVIKRIELRLSGSFDVTYAAGAPISSPTGFLSRILPGGVSVVADGSRYIKSVDAYLQRMSALMHTAQLPERAFSNSVAAPTTNLGQTESQYDEPFTYPATTNFVVINESFTISFECEWAYAYGRQSTLFNTKGLSSAVLQFSFGPIESVQADVAAPVTITYGNISLNIVATLVTSPDVPREQKFMDFRESFKRESFSGETRARAVECPKGNFLAAIEFLVNNGDAGLTLSDVALREIELRMNGSRVIQSTSFLALQQGYRMSRGIGSPKSTAGANGVTHIMQGYAPMVLLKNGDLRTMLDTRRGSGVDQLQLYLTTAAATGIDAATYTNPVVATLAFGEIVEVQ